MTFSINLISQEHEDFKQIKKWRDSYIGLNPANEDFYSSLEVNRDKFSYNLAFYFQNELFGGVRLTPLGQNLTMGEKELNIQRFLHGKLDWYLEVNRLVINEKKRGGIRVKKI